MAFLYLYRIAPMSCTHILGLVAAESNTCAASTFCNKVGFQTVQDYTNAWSHRMKKIMIEQSNVDSILNYSIGIALIPNFTKLETLFRHYNVKIGDYIILPSLEELSQCRGFKSIAKYKLKKYCL